MKRELILSSLLLFGSTTGLKAQDIQQVQSRVVMERKQLMNQAFESEQVFTRDVHGRDEQGHWVTLGKKNYKLQIKFMPIQTDYEYDGEGKLEFEVMISEVNVGDGTIDSEYYGDTIYMAKYLSGFKYKLYNCNSTANCSDSFLASEFYAFDTPQGKIIKLKDPAAFFDDEKPRNMLFREVKL